MYNSWWYKSILHPAMQAVSSVNWESLQPPKLTESDKTEIADCLAENYCVCLNRKPAHLSTYLIDMGQLIAYGKGGYVHTFANTEGDVLGFPEEFELIEATGSGVHTPSFHDVTSCDWFCALKPVGYSASEWNEMFQAGKNKHMGKRYDDLCNQQDDDFINCIELIRRILLEDPFYMKRMYDFEQMHFKYKQLTPQMIRDCKSFEVVLEIKR